MIWEFPVWLWGSSWSSPSPGNGVDLEYAGTVSPTVDWTESSCPPMVCDGMVHCPLLACQPCCNVVCLLLFFSWEKSIFVPLMSAAYQPTCASWWWCWYLLRGGWPALWSGVECCVCKHWDLSTCHGSHIGCQNWAVMGLPPHSGGVACALGPQWWTNNSTDWLDIR